MLWISFNLLTFPQTRTTSEIGYNKITLSSWGIKISFLHLQMTNKCVVPYLLHNLERIYLNIPCSKLHITLYQPLYWTFLHKHQHFHCIFPWIWHYLTFTHIPHKLKTFITMNIRLLYFFNQRTKISFLFFLHPFLSSLIPTRFHLQLLSHPTKTRFRIWFRLDTFLLSNCR